MCYHSIDAQKTSKCRKNVSFVNNDVIKRDIYWFLNIVPSTFPLFKITAHLTIYESQTSDNDNNNNNKYFKIVT